MNTTLKTESLYRASKTKVFAVSTVAMLLLIAGCTTSTLPTNPPHAGSPGVLSQPAKPSDPPYAPPQGPNPLTPDCPGAPSKSIPAPDRPAGLSLLTNATTLLAQVQSCKSGTLSGDSTIAEYFGTKTLGRLVTSETTMRGFSTLVQAGTNLTSITASTLTKTMATLTELATTALTSTGMSTTGLTKAKLTATGVATCTLTLFHTGKSEEITGGCSMIAADTWATRTTRA